MSKWQPFNLNHYVRVKLKDEGIKHLKANHDEFLSKESGLRRTLEEYKAEADSEGYHKFQMHEFMRVFGSGTTLGFERRFETEILIETK